MNRKPAGRSRRGFTLIELMVVVGIIALLIAIAIPAFSAARKASKTTATNATISVLGLGLEQFRADAQLGGNYPPSVRAEPVSPHIQNNNSTTIEVGGANLLAWALAGADLLGTPGFRNIDANSNNDIFGGWLSDTGTRYDTGNPTASSLYALDSNLRPAHTRSGPYVELSKMSLPKRAGDLFDIPAGRGQIRSICFLDTFDQPILYYKANVGTGVMAASGQKTPELGGNVNRYADSGGANATYVPSGIYNLRDNSLITGNGTDAGLDLGAGGEHFSGAADRLGGITAEQYVRNPKANQLASKSFQRLVWNSNVTATLRPQREDSFILLSAGADGLFGTGDDVANINTNQ
jgi:prepilin-type N-terminal cleavage/methylation domain-containing protein